MIGTIIGNYKLTDKLGEGGMGAVFKGIDLMLEREVAIKVLRPELLSNADVVERFRSEAVTLAKLNHPHIATLYSFFRQSDEFFMVLEFVPGETLDALVQRCGALADGHAAHLINQALDGIAHAHEAGIIHRDIKPANLMLASSNIVKVMDFGIARALGNNRMTRAGRLVGTIEYMSPEQIRGQEVDARSDFYSLGAVLYEMVTGRLPFQSNSEWELMRAQIEDAPQPPRQIAPHISSAMERLILRALAKQPEDRFQSAAEFRADLVQIIAVSGVPTTVSTTKSPVPETRIGFCGVVSDELIKSTSLDNATTIAPLPLRKSVHWKPMATIAAIATTVVISFGSLTNRSQPPQPQPTQVVAAPAVVPTPEPSALSTPSPNFTPAQSNNVSTLIPAISASSLIGPTPKPIVQAKPNSERVEKTKVNGAARQTETARKRRLADQILNQ